MHEGWEFTTELKIKSIWKKNIWVLAYLLKGKKPINMKWVYKVKPTLDGKLNKSKVCIVVRGFEFKRKRRT
jgi:hypothetical protein